MAGIGRKGHIPPGLKQTYMVVTRVVALSKPFSRISGMIHVFVFLEVTTQVYSSGTCQRRENQLKYSYDER
jgi:hypothetical protein